MGVDPGSFRDPAGVVLAADDRIFRAISSGAWADFDAARSSGLLERLSGSGRLVSSLTRDAAALPDPVRRALPPDLREVVEHEPIPFVSYPYEWPFALLRRAAVLHLELHLELLASGFTLSDGSAYNVQYRGTKPVFIDVLSIRRYRDGDYWEGYRQFCEQFVNPLLLTTWLGVPYQALLRGSPEGIAVGDAARLLPWRARFSWRALLHVFLHDRLSGPHGGQGVPRAGRPMTLSTMRWFLGSLKTWLEGLRPRSLSSTTWSGYRTDTSYDRASADAKRAFVASYARGCAPGTVLDLGCNTGVYAEAALASGVRRVIGFDSDLGSLEAAVARADAKHLDFLPLFSDAANPSPDQGWAQRERRGFATRAVADGLLALALLHHLVIGRNIPLEQATEWLSGLAPSGVIEFVPREDPMVQRMLAGRRDIFAGYTLEAFRDALSARRRITSTVALPGSARTLVMYQ